MSDYCYDRECPTNGGFSFPCSRCLDGMMGKAPRRIAGNQRASTSENAGAEAPSKPDSVTAPVFRPEKFDADNPPPAELSEFIRPVGSATDAITSGGEAGAPNPQTSVVSILSKEK